jgi:hypothetical protein
MYDTLSHLFAANAASSRKLLWANLCQYDVICKQTDVGVLNASMHLPIKGKKWPEGGFIGF